MRVEVKGAVHQFDDGGVELTLEILNGAYTLLRSHEFVPYAAAHQGNGFIRVWFTGFKEKEVTNNAGSTGEVQESSGDEKAEIPVHLL